MASVDCIRFYLRSKGVNTVIISFARRSSLNQKEFTRGSGVQRNMQIVQCPPSSLDCISKRRIQNTDPAIVSGALIDSIVRDHRRWLSIASPVGG